MTKCYVDSVLIVDSGRIDDTAILVKEADIFVTSFKKKNCGERVSIKKGIHNVHLNVFDYVEDIVI
jgi:hypothetical protein